MAARIVFVDVSFALRFLDCLESADAGEPDAIVSGWCGEEEGGGNWRTLSSATFGSGCCDDARRRKLLVILCVVFPNLMLAVR
jgi:hypothetical protein